MDARLVRCWQAGSVDVRPCGLSCGCVCVCVVGVTASDGGYTA